MTEIAKLLVDCDAVRFGDFTLTSGAKSDHYVDVKAALCQPAALRQIAAAMAVAAATDGPFDGVGGMELGAVPLATAVSLECNLPLLMIRKGERAHGTGKQVETALGDLQGKNILVVEDVTTSGGSTVAAVQVLRAAGAIVKRAYVVVDRESGGHDALNAVDVELTPLARISEILAMREVKQ